MKVRVQVVNIDGRRAERLLTDRDGPHTICHVICGLTRTLIDTGEKDDEMRVRITVDEPRESGD